MPPTEECRQLIEAWDRGDPVELPALGGFPDNPTYEYGLHEYLIEAVRFGLPAFPEVDLADATRDECQAAFDGFAGAVRPHLQKVLPGLSLSLTMAQGFKALGVAWRFLLDGPKATLTQVPQGQIMEQQRRSPVA